MPKKNNIKSLIKLLTAYTSSKYETAMLYLETMEDDEVLDDIEIDRFLSMTKYLKFLNEVSKAFLEANKIKILREEPVKVLFFYAIFVLDEDNFRDILNFDVFYKVNLLKYVCDENNHIVITQIACKIFENEFVLNEILDPLFAKIELIQFLLQKIETDEQNKIKKKPTTVSVGFKGLTNTPKKQPVPPNTPKNVSQIKVIEVPDNVKFFDGKILKKLKIAKEQNRLNAIKLLNEANKVSERLIKKLPRGDNDVKSVVKPVKSKKLPQKKEVEIKGNLTTTLREASRLIRKQEDEIKNIEDIIKGGYTADNFEQVKKQRRENETLLDLEEIERKHLQAKLVYEEAILAKNRVLEENKRKILEIKEEKIETMEKVEKWKQQERQNLKLLVEKAHNIERNCKESEKRIQEEKQLQVRMQQFETKKFLKDAMEEKEKELKRKIDLIQELKALHEIKINMNVKEFDPTECPNLGLLGEMSIAELQERLSIAKIKMEEELQEKRNNIAKKKEEQQMMVENVKQFVAQTRQMSKPSQKLMSIRTTKMENSPDLMELRRLLEEKRSLRMSSKTPYGKCTST